MSTLQLLIDRARAVAIVAHHGQTRRDGVTPYYTHPEAVATAVPVFQRPIAWLHDIVEDTSVTLELLAKLNFPSYILEAVDALTRRPDETYHAYMARVMNNRDAMIVKAQDMRHNLACSPSEKSKEKIALYLPVIENTLKRFSN